MRSSVRKRFFNDRRRRSMREAITSFRKFIKAGEVAGATTMMTTLQKAIDKAEKIGVITKNNASRKKSRLAHLLAGSTELSKEQIKEKK